MSTIDKIPEVTKQIDEFVKAMQNEFLIVSSSALVVGTAGLRCAAYTAGSSDLNQYFGAWLDGIYRKVYALQSRYSVEIVEVRYVKKTDNCFYTLEHDGNVVEVKIM